MLAVTGQELLTTKIQYSGKRCMVVCDHKCSKAWGINGNRPRINFDDVDDHVWLADNEVDEEAPKNPGTYEGGQGKPFEPTYHNKWCARQCERSNIVGVGEEIACLDFSHRIYNQPFNHDLKDNPKLATGIIFT
jgi:hypothetical protein